MSDRDAMAVLVKFTLLLLDMYYESERNLIPYTSGTPQKDQEKLDKEVSDMREMLQEIAKKV